MNYVVKNSYRRKIRSIYRSLFYILIIMLAITFFYAFTIFSSKPTSFIEVKVKSGDTLWSIAGRFNSNQIDLRKLVYQIKEINSLNNSVLQPGQILKIPNR